MEELKPLTSERDYKARSLQSLIPDPSVSWKGSHSKVHGEVNSDEIPHHNNPSHKYIQLEQEDKFKGRNLALHRYTTTLSQFWKDGWGLEILSCCLAAACLIAIVVTLAIHQDDSLPRTPSSISINTLVAVFTTIMKASLLMPITKGISQLKWLWFRQPHALLEFEEFDAASRGPWGSFLLFIQLRKHYLATFGAFISIVALAVGPFSQQIIQYYNCLEVVPELTAQIPRTNNFTGAGQHIAAGEVSLAGSMQAAIYLGLLGSSENGTSRIPIQCQTGDCVFHADNGASFSTLAICHSCTDISDSIQDNSVASHYNYTLSTSSSSFPNGPPNIGGLNTTICQTKLAYGEMDNLFSFAALMLNLNYTCSSGNNPECPLHPWATKCSLYPCIKTYGANITNQILEEKLLSTVPVPFTVFNASNLGSVQASMIESFSLATNRTLRNGFWYDCNPSDKYSESTPIAINVNNTLQLHSVGSDHMTSWYPSDCVWVFDGYSTRAINQFLGTFFDTQDVIKLYGEPFDMLGPLWIMDLYRNGTANLTTINQWIDGLAESITILIRQQGQSSGTVMESRTCIRVRWAWLSLPVLLVLCSILFLILTIWSVSAAKWQGNWKSSALASLFHGLNADIRQKYGYIENNSEMDLVAKNLQVRLRQTEHGQTFVETT